jgi:hypothetical protein
MGCPMKNQPMFLVVISAVILSAAISNANAENTKLHYKQHSYHKTSSYSKHSKPQPHIYEFGQ